MSQGERGVVCVCGVECESGEWALVFESVQAAIVEADVSTERPRVTGKRVPLFGLFLPLVGDAP